jgi:uncharacterized protein
MLNLSLTAVARDPVRLHGELAVDDAFWNRVDLAPTRPLQYDLEARPVGEGILVRGKLATGLEANCRRCLVPVPVEIEHAIDLLYEPISASEEVELGGEVYRLPERGDTLDLTPAVREQLVLRIPDFVLCGETCRGLCPRCGAELNRTTCQCVPESDDSPWDALKKIKFD